MFFDHGCTQYIYVQYVRSYLHVYGRSGHSTKGGRTILIANIIPHQVTIGTIVTIAPTLGLFRTYGYAKRI